MNLTRTWAAGLLLAGCALATARARADVPTDIWQDKPAAANAATMPSDDWQPKGTGTRRTTVAADTTPSEDAPSHEPARRPAWAQRPVTQQWVGPQRVARRWADDTTKPEPVPMPDTPGTPITPRAETSGQVEVVEPGTIQFEAVNAGGVVYGNRSRMRRGCASCGQGGGVVVDGGDCGDCGPCDPCVEQCDECDYGYEVFDGRCGRWLRDFSFFAGVDGFKGGRDRGRNGNFGFNEGLNLGGPLGDPWGCGYQIGANFVQSDFSGSGAPSLVVDDTQVSRQFRRQTFITAGIFQRALCSGFQWGVAFDYLHDDYKQNADLTQIRSELGFVFDSGCEIGYLGAYGVGSGSDSDVTGNYWLDPVDMFAMYLGRNFENGGQGRLWGGATSKGDGLLGANLWMPLGRGFALENRATYLIPKEGHSDTGQQRESWGLTMQLVWYPAQTAKCQQKNLYRSLFPVADNATFMANRREQGQ
jgi:hypothetical protein